MSALTSTEQFLSLTVTAATPLLLATLGEIISERSGVLNLGVEGMMLVGAFVGYVVAGVIGNPYIGFLAGTIAGAALGSIHAFLSITMKADQVISGIMLTLLGLGLTTFLGNATSLPSTRGFQQVAIPVVGKYLIEMPLLGTAIFRSTPPDFLGLISVPIVWYFLFKTKMGLEIIAVGDDPETADTMGVKVFRIQYLCVLIGGAFAGAAGAHLSLAFVQIWAAGMVAGRGWIAIALVIFSQWRPWRGLLGAYLFAGLQVMVIQSQSFTLSSQIELLGPHLAPIVNILLRPNVISSYPYLLTIVVLVVVKIRREESYLGPSALLQPYIREGS